ncbi:type II toxin-antitoxin system HipA family toxin [Shewanella benthica]|uniref:HipA-like C-terminal domain-containing protein n=1 Tax=Shewanella benthica KT99 TaxID=314608 RepID=A9DFH5_9GAMM|nr:HipA domain-containing protein [Shewanella benthica]EDP99912.1 hypothetical protein KT99_05562 [Shewanella benthica KT99]
MALPELLDSNNCRLDYEFGHVLLNYHQFANTALSIRLLVDNMTYRETKWFRFLDDIMPAGSSRKYWINKLGLKDEKHLVRNFELLSKGTVAPIGNLRIKESVPDKVVNAIPVSFTIDDVCRLEVDFIEYAQTHGAASGAGGAAPKLLVRCDKNDCVWIDTFQDDPTNLDTRYWVKFARGLKAIDKDILRAEYHFYHELTSLNFDTISISKMRLEESEKGPSLWLPRFDTIVIDGREQLLGMESVYSVLDEGPATALHHGDVIRRLISTIQNPDANGTTETFLDDVDGKEAFIIEWVRRDLLNIAFGNSDNHGRNTSFIKRDNKISLSPIYDFAPMKADPETITRTFTWGPELEKGGEYNYPAIAESLSDLIDPQRLMSELRDTAKKLLGLRERLLKRGVPDSILNFPSMNYENLENKFKRWNLL